MNWQAGEAWLPKKLEFVPQRHFQTDRDTSELLYLNMGIPEPLRPMGWLVHEHRAKSGYIEQAALFRVLAWTYAYKAYNIKDMQRFLEVYGLPLRLGKYPAGIGDKQRNELLKAVRSIGNDGAGVVPSTMSIDFMQAQTGKIDDFLNTVAYWESKQSKAILGGELDGKTTSEARIMLYDKVRREILAHDVKQLNPTYSNGLLKPICLINGLFPENRLPTWHHDTEEPADQQALVDVLIKAAGLGMEIDIDWAHGSLQIPRAKEGAVLLTTGATANKAALKSQWFDKLTTNGNSVRPEPVEGDIKASLANQLTALSMPFEQAQLERIAAIIGDAGDFESALAEIAALNSAPIYKEWVKMIADGMTAANLAGRVEATHE
jgi:phage gp29-like protein